MAEKEILELKSTIKNTERILEIERQDRASTEHKTLQVLADVRKKWAKAEEQRMEELRTELTEVKEKSGKFETENSALVRQNTALRSELDSVKSVKTQLKNKLKDYKQRLENVATTEHDRTQTIAKLEAEVKGLKTNVSQANDALDETKAAEGKLDALQMIIEQRDHLLAEKDSEIKIKAKELRARLSELEGEVKKKSVQVVKLIEDLEAARNESTLFEESQIGIHTQLKADLKATMKENSDLSRRLEEMRMKEEKLGGGGG